MPSMKKLFDLGSLSHKAIIGNREENQLHSDLANWLGQSSRKYREGDKGGRGLLG